MLHGEMSGGERPLEPLGDLSEQYFFFYLSIHIIDIVGWQKQVTLYHTHHTGGVTDIEGLSKQVTLHHTHLV